MWVVENNNFRSLLSFWFQEWLRHQKIKESDTNDTLGLPLSHPWNSPLRHCPDSQYSHLGPAPCSFILFFSNLSCFISSQWT